MSKVILNVVSYPGSGTHLFMDIMTRLNVDHNPVGDLIFKIIMFKKGCDISDLGVHDYNFDTFKKIIHSIYDVDLYLDYAFVAKCISDFYLSGVEDKDYFIMQPHVNYDRYIEKYDVEWKKEDSRVFSQILKKSIEISGKKYKEVFYIRNPSDIFVSKSRRFHKTEQDKEREIDMINSFFIENKESILVNCIKYEDMCNNIKGVTRKIIKLIEHDENEGFVLLKNIIVYNTNIGYKNNLKNRVVNAMYMYEDGKFEYSFFYKIVYLTILAPIWALKRFVNEIRVIYQFCLKGDYSNDGAFTRHKFSVVSKVFEKLIRIIPRFNNKVIKGLNYSHRVQRGNLFRGF